MVSSEDLLSTLVKHEKILLEPEVRHNQERLNRYLADDFEEITGMGETYTKSHAYCRLSNEKPVIFYNGDFKLVKLSRDIFRLNYRAVIERDNKKYYSLRTSIWRYTNSGWQITFHQGTPCQPFDY